MKEILDALTKGEPHMFALMKLRNQGPLSPQEYQEFATANSARGFCFTLGKHRKTNAPLACGQNYQNSDGLKRNGPCEPQVRKGRFLGFHASTTGRRLALAKSG